MSSLLYCTVLDNCYNWLVIVLEFVRNLFQTVIKSQRLLYTINTRPLWTQSKNTILQFRINFSFPFLSISETIVVKCFWSLIWWASDPSSQLPLHNLFQEPTILFLGYLGLRVPLIIDPGYTSFVIHHVKRDTNVKIRMVECSSLKILYFMRPFHLYYQNYFSSSYCNFQNYPSWCDPYCCFSSFLSSSSPLNTTPIPSDFLLQHLCSMFPKLLLSIHFLFPTLYCFKY